MARGRRGRIMEWETAGRPTEKMSIFELHLPHSLLLQTQYEVLSVPPSLFIYLSLFSWLSPALSYGS